MLPDEPNEEERLQKLDQDGATPFQPADPNPSPTGNTTDPVVGDSSSSDLPTDHPATDTGIDSTELYDAGVSAAAGADDQSSQSAVTSYDPDEDQTIEDEAL